MLGCISGGESQYTQTLFVPWTYTVNIQRWRVCVWLALALQVLPNEPIRLSLVLAATPTHTFSEGGRKAAVPRVWAHVMSEPHLNTNKHWIHKLLLKTWAWLGSFWCFSKLQVLVLLLCWQTHTGALVQDHKSGRNPPLSLDVLETSCSQEEVCCLTK